MRWLGAHPEEVEKYCKRYAPDKGICPGGEDPPKPYINYFWTWGNLGYLCFLEGGIMIWIIVIFLYNRHWWNSHTTKTASSLRRTEAEKISSDLLRFFVPSSTIHKHRFYGLKAKHHKVDIKFEHLGLQLKHDESEKGKLLRDCTGEFKSERMAAIMGPSGAGKTTLLNTLCGKATYGVTTGDILINNQPGDIKELKDIMGFVPQDDIVHEYLTVRENLMVTAMLKNKAGTHKLQEEIVEDVLNVMQITHIQQTIVGGPMAKGISGGQRKRVNIGLELVGSPTLLFLDEPTSGLDATTALAVVHCLKVLSSLGLTMVMSIHQPRYRLFEFFDDVCMLLKGGYTAYFGPARGAMPWFESLGFRMPENENPADWFMDVCSNEAEKVDTMEQKEDDGKLHRQMSGTHEIRSAWSVEGRSFVRRVAAERSRDWEAADDHRVLRGNLERQWSSMDPSNRGINMEKFKGLIADCTGQECDDETLDILSGRITHSPHSHVIMRDDFHRFLNGLFDVIQNGSDEEDTGKERRGSLASIGSQEALVEDADVEALEREIQNLAEPGAASPLLVIESTLPGPFTQFLAVLHRRILHWWRQILEICFFLGLAFVVGLVTGFFAYLMFLDPGLIEEVYACWIFQLITALMVALKSSFLFEDKITFWRERNRGLNVFSFFSAQVIVDLFFVEIPMSLVYVGTFYCCYVGSRPYPQTSLFSWYIPVRLLTFVATGWGYMISALFPTRLAAVGAVIVLFIVMAVGSPPVVHHFVGTLLEWFVFPVVTRWSTQWTTLAAIEMQRETQYLNKDCVGNKTMQEVQMLEAKVQNYTGEQCRAGQMGPTSFAEWMMKELHDGNNYEHFKTRYLMSYAADFMETRVNDAYEGGMLKPIFGEYGSIVVVLLTQAFLLYLACYLILRYAYRSQQI